MTRSPKTSKSETIEGEEAIVRQGIRDPAALPTQAVAPVLSISSVGFANPLIRGGRHVGTNGNSVGISSERAGIVLAFFFGYPQPSHEEGVSIGLQPAREVHPVEIHQIEGPGVQHLI